ncbi:MAG: hypothetical protein QMD32_02310 [Smithellaceae bacterium]|nr:hypothetical protein [Smithellaceae bacterium]
MMANYTKHLLSRRFLAFLFLFLLLVLPGCEGARDRIALLGEKRAIEEAAGRYLEAEVKQDYGAVYESLGPSSVYRKGNTYDQYLEQAKGAPGRLLGYKILRISRLTENHDRRSYPGIDKFVRVEVEVIFEQTDSKQRTEANYDYTFIKEGGKWYKG